MEPGPVGSGPVLRERSMGRKGPCTRSGENVPTQSWCGIPNQSYSNFERRRLAFAPRQLFSGEHTRLACRSRRLAAKYPSSIRPIGEGADRNTRGGCAPQKVSCANPTIVTSSGADEQLRPFTNWRARSYCEHSVCRVFMDACRQHLAAIARLHSR